MSDDSLRIGMILEKEFPPDPRVLSEAQALIKMGNQVVLFCYDKRRNFKKYETVHSIEVHRSFLPKIVYKLSALAYSFPFYRWYVTKDLRHFLETNNFDIVHVHDMIIAKSAFQLKSDVPFVLDLHENRPEIMKHYDFMQKLSSKLLIYPSIWKKNEERLVRKADGVVLVTEVAKTEMISRVPEAASKIIAVPNYIDRDRFNSLQIDLSIVERYKDNFTILYVGDTSSRRGLESVVRALPSISKQIPNISLLIVGKSTFDSKLKEIAESLGVEEYVNFTGWVNEDMIPSYIEACTIGISPLLRNLHHDTTYANKIFQYLAKKKPVLLSDVLAQEDLIEKYKIGEVHKAGSVVSIIEKIVFMQERLESNPNFYFQRLEDFFKDFSSERIHGNLLSMYHSLIKN